MLNIWHIYHIKHQKTSFIRCCKSHKLYNIEQQPHIFTTVRMKCGINLLFFFSVFLSPLISLIDFFSPQSVFFALLTICLSLPNRCSLLGCRCQWVLDFMGFSCCVFWVWLMGFLCFLCFLRFNGFYGGLLMTVVVVVVLFSVFCFAMDCGCHGGGGGSGGSSVVVIDCVRYINLLCCLYYFNV